MSGDSSETIRLVERVARGETEPLESLLVRHRPRLLRMVEARLDRRLKARIDPSDVIQETYLEAASRLTSYLRSPRMPFFVWLRFLTSQKIVTLHRRHLGVGMRDVDQEAAIFPGEYSQESAAVTAPVFLDHGDRPSEAARRGECAELVHRALDGLSESDREVLVLRHFEQLSRAEIAVLLGVSEAAAGKRYLRALERLKHVLTLSGGWEI